MTDEKSELERLHTKLGPQPVSEEERDATVAALVKRLRPAFTTLTDGSPVTPDHREIDPKTGMQKGYVVLSEDERAKGFVEPVRRSYVHLTCGGVTTMGISLAETYARDPFFYSGTYCAICGTHFPTGEDGQFVWDGTEQKVGTRKVQP